MFKTILSEQYIHIVRYIEILIVILLIPLLYNFIPIDNKASETFYIDAANTESIVSSLEKSGYTVTLLDKMMMQMHEVPTSGWYTLPKKGQGRYAFFKNIYLHKTATMQIVIYAGETHTEIIKRLANDMKLDAKKLNSVYESFSRFKEAEIFSGRYNVARTADEKSLMTYLFSESNKILDLFIQRTFRDRPSDFEIKVLLTIASIIQKESNAVEEMPHISAVIYNRLNKKMKLQMDSTLNYGAYSHTIVTPERIKTDYSYYNTYKYKGLPPYPLASISIDALRAAMYPKKNKDIFFMLKPDGSHVFCATYEEHLKNIRTFRAYQKACQVKKEEKEKLEKKKLEEELAEHERMKKVKASDNNESNKTKAL